jgi:hypothetical protein
MDSDDKLMIHQLMQEVALKSPLMMNIGLSSYLGSY